MRIVPVYVWDKLPIPNKEDRLVGRSEGPVLRKVIEQHGIKLRRPQEKDSYLLERILLDSRVLIIEGISGSGKDTFQTYLKKKLKGRDVYDYSEGEVLHSWKQFQIEGILKLRVKFMKLFVNYVRKIVSRDENAVFLLNRFHLSTYAWTIIQQQKLGREYDEIINVLRVLPVHVFILHLDENEIEKRSLHPEIQQKLILEAARRQQIPYSVIKLPSHEPTIGNGQMRRSKALSIHHRGVRTNSADTKTSRRRRRLPPTVQPDN
jgi:thymidylate kinase